MLELLHKIEETAEGCRELAKGGAKDLLQQHWKTLQQHYKKLCLYFQTNSRPAANNLQIYLPDCDDKPVMLDLASGNLHTLPDIQNPQELIAAIIDKLDKGDIIYDTKSLVFLRSAKCKKSIPHPEGLALTIHKIPADELLPETIIVTNRQGVDFTLDIVSVDEGGCNLRYERLAKAETSKTKFGPVDFEGYFPDSPSGAEKLEKLFNDPKKDTAAANEIIETARNGLRRYKGRENILRWVGNLFVWGKNPQNEKAIELMYHASGSPDRGLYGDAVYFGLSVTNDKTPEILAALAAVAMKTEDYYNVTGRINWGCSNQKDQLMACLVPYLDSQDEAIREKAQSVKSYLTDSKAFMTARAEEHKKTVTEEQSGNLEGYRKSLLTGDSQTRMQTLQQIQSKSVMTIIDESFLDAFEACVKDTDAKVREKAARMIGGKFIWGGANPQSKRAIEILVPLLGDANRQVKYAAVYYGLSTVSSPDKQLLTKTLETILDDREVNYFGRVIWGAKRNRNAVKDILTEWINQTQDTQKAVKAYEIYEDVMQQPLDEETAKRFAGKKSGVHEGLATMAISSKPIDKDTMVKQFTGCLADNELLTKISELYILENRDTAIAMFICGNLTDRNAIRKALAKAYGFNVDGYIDGRIGPTGSGWISSLENFKKQNEPYRIDMQALASQ